MSWKKLLFSVVVSLIVAGLVSYIGRILLSSSSVRSYFESIDNVMIVVGFVLAVAKICYDLIEKWQFNQLSKARALALKSSGVGRVKASEVKPDELDRLILIMPPSHNLTPLYLLNYFRPKKVAFIWSEDKDCIRYTNCLAKYLGENVDEAACSADVKKQSSTDENEVYQFLKDKKANFETEVISYPASSSKFNLQSVNYFMVDDIVGMVSRAHESIALTPVNNTGIDITSATSLCSVAGAIAADKRGLSPVYLHVSQSRVLGDLPKGANKTFICLQDVQALIEKGTSMASDRGITIYEVWWTKQKDYISTLFGR